MDDLCIRIDRQIFLETNVVHCRLTVAVLSMLRSEELFDSPLCISLLLLTDRPFDERALNEMTPSA